MSNLNKSLAFSLKWLSIESIVYHAIFLVHQAFLFKYAGAHNYGAISVIFSIIYLATTISTFGLESSLSPFFKKIMACKTNFKKFFIIQILPTIFLSTLTIPILILLKNNKKLTNKLFLLFTQDISYFFIFIIFILILSESVKKVLRGFLYLNLKNKFNMALEIGTLIAYVTTIWSVYAVTNKITINLIFIPMTVTSIISSFILLIFTNKIYAKLPESTSISQNIINNIFNNSVNTKNLQYKILKTRAINFANQFTHNIFSSNFLVPFFALQFGLAQAGIFKLLSHISYTLTMILRKIFGWASDTILAHTKDLDIAHKQDMFHNINNKINNIMLALVIFLTINLTKIINHTNNTQTNINWPLIYFFLAITLIENLFISYEKFYIAEEKNSVILTINAASIFVISIIIFYSHFFAQLGQSGQNMLLFAITATRATCFIILAVISYYSWRIKPKFIIKPIYLIISLIISLITFKSI